MVTETTSVMLVTGEFVRTFSGRFALTLAFQPVVCASASPAIATEVRITVTQTATKEATTPHERYRAHSRDNRRQAAPVNRKRGNLKNCGSLGVQGYNKRA